MCRSVAGGESKCGEAKGEAEQDYILSFFFLFPLFYSKHNGPHLPVSSLFFLSPLFAFLLRWAVMRGVKRRRDWSDFLLLVHTQNNREVGSLLLFKWTGTQCLPRLDHGFAVFIRTIEKCCEQTTRGSLTGLRTLPPFLCRFSS